ncbi:hypothetical protein WICANDRAFT_81202 [Wickerhamomyces anomalus NRRL Y-366-8]|uniref:PTM1-like N-terminal domain-containing protein n=1 Tax=Wickerhamomyces anomalus (strain ATCC 58044 / CBS 1984 / NCYC 433 / NRRL Y-366-8) TaxID=683960 RepID=A0A1E3NV54_WICAA|nr:uncharacterized protein WICANDRAFT_81202 [Wickerhamomyces anomalus NRRL Y-366-8]ODQ56964.1 hypothetical protein WICANDRAFT_81202 [Wickerhamomyces anomalus NRRL Y-366-8]
MLKSLVFLIALIQLCLCDSNYTISDSYELCFSIDRADENQPILLDVALLEYEPLPGLTPEESKTSVPIIIYNENEINHEKQFAGVDSSTLNLCNDDAIKRGYCQKKHKGKILFEYNEGAGFKGNTYNEILNELGTFKDVFQFNKTGFYCARALGTNAKNFKVQLFIKGDSSTDHIIKKNRFVNLFSVFILVGFGGLYLSKWLDYSKTFDTKIPYLVKVLLAYIATQLTISVLKSVSAYIYDHPFESSNGHKVLSAISSSISKFQNAAMLFYLYQYSGNFTTNKIEFEYKKVFGTFCFVDMSAIVFYKLVRDHYYERYHEPGAFSLIYGSYELILILLFLFQLVIKVRIFLRYYRTAKGFYGFQQNPDHPKLDQFKWLILTNLFWELFEHMFHSMFEEMMHKVFRFGSHNLTNFMFNVIDGDYSQAFLDTIVLGVEFYVLLNFWTPDYFLIVEDYNKDGE